MTTNFFNPLFGSCFWIRDPGWVKIRIQDKHPGSATLQASVLPPEPKGEGTHSPAGEGVGESQFQRLEKKLSTLPTLCGFECGDLPVSKLSGRFARG